ncbi:hypothetical protein JCM10512_62 [Bacteroides reticulotermitis JCM 10512]|uniref:Uncharacterized protein n=1 Tax=Bacteroides reticulotermitis JCM 10512 TaxID=1445607 RepID=W4UMZ1_9BACE|nr:hypothetical protein JCM10512_62 [Bacteroides reticulotermitis JCM 10512]
MHPYSETGREGKPPPALIQGEYNRIISQYGYRQPAVSYERFSLPGGMDTQMIELSPLLNSFDGDCVKAGHDNK